MKLKKQGTTRMSGSTADGERFTVILQPGIDSRADLTAARDEIVRRVSTYGALVQALKRSQELFEKALPKFNWGSSFLNAEAIRLLNEVPIEVANALAAASETRTNTTPDAKTGINEKDIQ